MPVILETTIPSQKARRAGARLIYNKTVTCDGINFRPFLSMLSEDEF
jgi:hypothetical protein